MKQLDTHNQVEKFSNEMAAIRSNEKSAQAESELLNAIADYGKNELNQMIAIVRSSREAATLINNQRDETARMERESQIEDLNQMRAINERLFDLQYRERSPPPPSVTARSFINAPAQSSAQVETEVNWNRIGTYVVSIAAACLVLGAAALKGLVGESRPQIFTKVEP